METNIKQSSSKTSSIKSEIKEKHNRKNATNRLLWSFGLMIALTCIAFVAVASAASEDPVIPATFVVPFIILLAVIQVVVQLFIFMHLEERGSQYFIYFIFTGVFVAVITVIALMLWVWWS